MVELELLMAVADTLAGVVMRRPAHGQLEALRRHLAQTGAARAAPPADR